MILAASMALPPPKLTIPSARALDASSTPPSIWDIGACCAMTTVATGLTESLSTEESSERVVTSTVRSVDNRVSSDERCETDPAPQRMTRGFE